MAAERQLIKVARAAVIGVFVSIVTVGFAAAQGESQGLTVLPVSILLMPGQMTTTLTIQNHYDSDTAFQVRSFAWRQSADADQLTPSDDLLASPPLGSITAGATQVVRLVLLRPPQSQEAAYRIIFDQIPPPAAPGTVRIALRLSIPVFAEPPTRVAPHLQWYIENDNGQAYLVATNDGNRHDTVRDIALTSLRGTLKVEADVSPYVLAGATRRWRILTSGPLPSDEGPWRLTAHSDSGGIDQKVSVGIAQR
jgi:fimbrial chaperone protein